LLVIDSLRAQQRTLALKKDPDCPLCGRQPSITCVAADNYSFNCQTEHPANDTLMEITIDQLDHYPNPTFLDVREAFEVEICKIDNALHIPLSRLPQQYAHLPAAGPLVVYCHHGMRSLRATEFLHSVGKTNAVSLVGGIDAWAITKDPGMLRY
jgi:adenylyltransferase/sulfurtransferase